MPYWLWVVLPEVFADKLPNRPGNGYERLGFTYETPTSDLPIGASRSDGLDSARRTELRDVSCRHLPGRAGRGAEDRAGDAGASDGSPGLCAVPVRRRQGSALQRRHAHRRPCRSIPEFGFFDGLVYRLFAIGRTKEGILERDPRIAWFDKRPPQGPGRVDTFNPYKAMFAEENELRDRRHRRHGRSAVALESADAPGTVAALGRQQQLRRRAQQERGDRRRRDARFPRSRRRSIGSPTGFSISSRRRIPADAHRRGAGEPRARRSISSTARAATTSASRGSDR